ncbi:MAG TPA: carboxyl transferase domain-containing protein, partial [Chitinophagales bacterium]|nr:carboxyl transferase domain-containing protein [Chitinophagales bacterium]
TAISGDCDYKVKDDKEALDTIKKLVNKYGKFEMAGFDRIKSKKPKAAEKDIYGIFSTTKPYDVREIIKRLVDDSEFVEYKEDYGQTIVCANARIDGWSVGIVANQRSVVKSKKGEVQIGGVIYSDSADKAARFVMLCNQKKIPLVFLQDVTGFMVGSRSEHGGIIKDGAKMVNAVSNSTVPKFTIITGNSYGAGNYAMCGKAYDPRLIIAWPSAKIAVMGADQAAKTILQMQVGSLEAKNKTELPEEEKQKILSEIKERYTKQTSAYYAASRLWIDAVIDPLETRKWISKGVEAANNAPIKKFNVGVFQV